MIDLKENHMYANRGGSRLLLLCGPYARRVPVLVLQVGDPPVLGSRWLSCCAVENACERPATQDEWMVFAKALDQTSNRYSITEKQVEVYHRLFPQPPP